MTYTTTIFCCLFVFVTFVKCQNASPTLFGQQTIGNIPNIQGDPFLSNLFKDFVTKYQQLKENTEGTISAIASENTPGLRHRTALRRRGNNAGQTTTPFPLPHIQTSRFSGLEVRRRGNNAGQVTTAFPLPQIQQHRFSGLEEVRGRSNNAGQVTSPFPQPQIQQHRFSGLEEVGTGNNVGQIAISVFQPQMQQIRFSGLEEVRRGSNAGQMASFPVPQMQPNRFLEEISARPIGHSLQGWQEVPKTRKVIPFKTSIFNEPPVHSQVVTTQNTPTMSSPQEGVFDDKEFRRQAESAKYSFRSAIENEINGNALLREEIRDGLSLKGRYSFSDGFFNRSVFYEADDKGFRIVKEQVIPLQGPQANPDGHASVSAQLAGHSIRYNIGKNDIQGIKEDEKVGVAELPNIQANGIIQRTNILPPVQSVAADDFSKITDKKFVFQQIGNVKRN